MAVGNSGEHLDGARDAQCTWLSRNGGETWEDVAQGAFIYEFGDHGGIIVIAPHGTERPASNISFSLDEGRCWQTVHLAEAIDVANIRSVSQSIPIVVRPWPPVSALVHACRKGKETKRNPLLLLRCAVLEPAFGVESASRIGGCRDASHMSSFLCQLRTKHRCNCQAGILPKHVIM